MPYEPVPTQIQMAPLNMLPGIRLKTSHLRDRAAGKVAHYTAGLGQYASCPSLEQLMGITDPNDPCQNSAAATATAGLPVATTSFGTFLQQNAGILLAGVGGLLLIAAISGGRR